MRASARVALVENGLVLGILLGVYMANRMDTTKLRKMVAWVCLFCGGFIFVNAIRGILAM